MTFGVQGLRDYQATRKAELGKHPEFQYDDCFHNGKRVLDAVPKWHRDVRRACLSEGDMIARVLDMVDRMLNLHTARPSASSLCTEADDIWINSLLQIQKHLPTEGNDFRLIQQELASRGLENYQTSAVPMPIQGGFWNGIYSPLSYRAKNYHQQSILSYPGGNNDHQRDHDEEDKNYEAGMSTAPSLHRHASSDPLPAINTRFADMSLVSNGHQDLPQQQHYPSEIPGSAVSRRQILEVSRGPRVLSLLPPRSADTIPYSLWSPPRPSTALHM